MKRRGVLMHIASLHGEYGIGDFGPSAREFASYLAEAGYKIWQILPLNHCGYGNSPYNPVSAFAIYPALVSPQLLYEEGLLSLEDLAAYRLPQASVIHYDQVIKNKEELLAIATQAYLKKTDVNGFIEANSFWLKPYMCFIQLCRLYDDCAWESYSPEHQSYTPELYEHLWSDFPSAMRQIAATQAILHLQLHGLKEYLTELDVCLMGDMPIYLSYHSADVWANQDLFLLDGRGRRLSVAGVPPDAFSHDGQLWGNPIYRWKDAQAGVFNLFEQRIGHAFSYLDQLRLDHFIGYVNYWQVPCPVDPLSSAPVLPDHARDGAWINAPADEFFDRIIARFGRDRFIAEDLGILNEAVCRVREKYAFPGMIVLQFCFQDSVPDVSVYPSDRIIYTGTHDNPTSREWYEELDQDGVEHRHFWQWLDEHPEIMNSLFDGKKQNTFDDLDGKDVAQIMIAIAMQSGCDTVMIPMQDILGLDATARMNIPGTALGNWQWRMAEDI